MFSAIPRSRANPENIPQLWVGFQQCERLGSCCPKIQGGPKLFTPCETVLKARTAGCLLTLLQAPLGRGVSPLEPSQAWIYPFATVEQP